ncbi:MAG: tRNA (N6-isopentenyl adenosine(37)-C2)-methylthiotransferase MiaB [Acidobacteria bacterium]|nr:tRNA (N6-isopentenyl adenosine(37)-C2)-methylthiotransferase MiaB [Acidobacteriota bacterium]
MSREKYFIETWGCQMNLHDSERMAGILAGMGFEPALRADEADLILLNSCAVRDKAEQKVYTRLGELRMLKRKRPDLLIGLCGCVAQLEGASLLKKQGRGVDILIGPRGIPDLPKRIREARRVGKSIDLSYRKDAVLYEPEEVLHGTFPKAFVNVMEGCNMNCAFCIIPRTRGREIYRPADKILEEIRLLANDRFLEVELLGQTVNAYRDGKCRLSDLLERIHSIDGIQRIRFTTSHPLLMNRRLMDSIRDLPKVCSYLHLPVQSGSNSILKSMQRGYSREVYREKIDYLRKDREISIGTDIIVGFPGESDRDHDDTLSLISAIGFDIIYSFKFSSRPGTIAAEMPDPVPENVKSRRLQELQALQVVIQRERNLKLIGRNLEVLVTGRSRKSVEELSGRSECHRVVNFTGPDTLLGHLAPVVVQGAGVHHLSGKWLPETGSA